MKIKFIPGTYDIEQNVPSPEPSRSLIPQWYKKIPGKKDIMNVKKCIPFLDSLSHGYVQKTWTDIYVEQIDNNISISFDHVVPIVKYRETLDIPLDKWFYNKEFVWQRPWAISLPKGFSGLITHPLNRVDLPFYTMSGIIDFDESVYTSIGNIPFYIKYGFSGIIPSGTPMFQIIPIKREDWTQEKDFFQDGFWQQKVKERSSIPSFYKKKNWQKKSFD